MTTLTRRRLILWRHAQSPWSEPDIDRVLSEPGRYQASIQAATLADDFIDEPSQWTVICSPAQRTRSTLAALLELSPVPDTRVSCDATVYNATTGDLQALVAGQPGHLLLVGHNPGLSQLAGWLADDSIRVSLAPGDFVAMDIPPEPDPGSGRLIRVVTAPDQR